MLPEMTKTNQPVNKQDVVGFARRHSLDLPKEYREFLARYNGGQPIPPTFPIEGFLNNPLGDVQVFFGLNAVRETEDLDAVMADHEDLIPAGILPIACTDGYDFVCLDLRGGKERVVYWDRVPFWGANVWNEEDLYFIASNFDDFLRGLREEPYGNIE